MAVAIGRNRIGGLTVTAGVRPDRYVAAVDSNRAQYCRMSSRNPRRSSSVAAAEALVEGIDLGHVDAESLPQQGRAPIGAVGALDVGNRQVVKTGKAVPEIAVQVLNE